MLRGLLAAATQVRTVPTWSTGSRCARRCRRCCTRCATCARATTATCRRSIVEPGVRTGVPVLTDNPKEVGTDRIVNALAAVSSTAARHRRRLRHRHDVRRGVGRRGSTSAARSRRASRSRSRRWAARGAQLHRVELARPRSVIGRTTVEALQSGILYGFAGQVDGVVDPDGRGDRRAGRRPGRRDRDRDRRPGPAGARRGRASSTPTSRG